MTLGGLVFSLFILIELPEIFQMTLGGLIFSLFILIDQEPSRLVLFHLSISILTRRLIVYHSDIEKYSVLNRPLISFSIV